MSGSGPTGGGVAGTCGPADAAGTGAVVGGVGVGAGAGSWAAAATGARPRATATAIAAAVRRGAWRHPCTGGAGGRRSDSISTDHVGRAGPGVSPTTEVLVRG